ncbi:MAG: type IV pilus modification PilV family protein [Planctomycetota bacterium]|jgi:prepilin-type N-terminal cleavage/methylation domain-containing protein
MRAPRGRNAGFTLIEILIAMVILMVGLVGIMSVYPQAVRAVNETIEKSYAAAISQSVRDAIGLGMREMRTPYPDWQAFILDHDGVKDLDVDRTTFLRTLDLADLKRETGERKPEFLTLLTKDYCVLMPRADETEPSGGSKPRGRPFLYPRKSPNDNTERKSPDRVPYTIELPDGSLEEGEKLEVSRVYELGQKLATSEDPNEFTQELDRNDPLSQFGFAFYMRAARAPSVDNPTPDRRQQDIVPGLYELVIQVYRNFDPEPSSKYNQPIDEFTTYMGAR